MIGILQDAACHLRKFGAAWKRDTQGVVESIYLDEKGEPKIGFVDDLAALSDNPTKQARAVAEIATKLLSLSAISCTQERYLLHTTDRSPEWHAQLFGAIVDAGYMARLIENTVRRADISGLVPLNQESLVYLRQTYESISVVYQLWGNILLRLALGSQKWPGSMLYAVYVAVNEPPDEGDYILETCIEDDSETVRVVKTKFEIPALAAEEVRQSLGICIQGRFWWTCKGAAFFELVRIARRGETLTECTGWRRVSLSGSDELKDRFSSLY